MKIKYSAPIVLFAGIGIGAAGVHTLHAQAKPPIYVVSEIDVKNDPLNGQPAAEVTRLYRTENVPSERCRLKAPGALRLIIASRLLSGGLTGNPVS